MLNSKQRSYLRTMANNVDAIMQVGKNGVDEGFLNQINEALEAREIVKVSVLKNSLYTAREACNEVCENTGSDPVQVIGNKFIVYKKSTEHPTIVLP